MRLPCLVLLGASLVTVSAQGFEPRPGDFALYASESGSNESYTKKKVDYREPNGSFRIGEYAVSSDQSSEELMFQYSIDGVRLKAAYIADLEEFCSSLRGTLGTVKTRAREMESCLVVQYIEDRKFADWYAAGIPFGIVKSHVSIMNGVDMITRDLVSFGRGVEAGRR